MRTIITEEMRFRHRVVEYAIKLYQPVANRCNDGEEI
jgi:hypothetical protein